MECYFYLRNVQELLSDGNTPHERRLGEPFGGPNIPFGSMVECHPILAKDRSRLHQFSEKVLPGIFIDYASYAGGVWKGDTLVADVEELDILDVSEIHARRLNAMEVLMPNKGEGSNSFFADGSVKLAGRDQVFRTPS